MIEGYFDRIVSVSGVSCDKRTFTFELKPYYWIKNIIAQDTKTPFTVSIDGLAVGKSDRGVFDVGRVFLGGDEMVKLLLNAYNQGQIVYDHTRDQAVFAERVKTVSVTFDKPTDLEVSAFMTFRVDVEFDGRTRTYWSRETTSTKRIKL